MAIGREWRSIQVNPAYSSVIGRVKFMERYGLSVHQAAALTLARRLLGCREGIPRPADCSVGQWRSRHLQRTREEAREACVVVLGSHIATAETGACSAASAGHEPILFGLRPGRDLLDAHSRVRVPGGRRHYCWGVVISKRR